MPVILAIALAFSSAFADYQTPVLPEAPETPKQSETPIQTEAPRQTVVFGGEAQTEAAPAEKPEVDQREAMLALVNELRGSVGAGELALDPVLCEAADIRAKEIAQSFSHTRPDGTLCFTVLADVGSDRNNYRAVGENIAAGSGSRYYTADAPFESWKRSSGHYANMISGDFTLIGIGSYNDGRMTYWVQFFGSNK
jgi:uncharacterized protein YkwD